MTKLTRLGQQLAKGARALRWMPAFCWQRVIRRGATAGPVHLIIAVADHFEPAIVPGLSADTYASMDEQERRLEQWSSIYPSMASPYRDDDGRPFVHTYFFPAEQYNKAVIDRLASHCQSGWGEVEIHLHHGIDKPDSPAHTQKTLIEFRDALAGHGCLSTWQGQGPPLYGFVHGNWALANSSGGRYCGVDEEMQILAETGCYADFTLPSAPDPAQVAKINSVYECGLPLCRRAPHRRGRDLRVGRSPALPLIVQGPLAILASKRSGQFLIPRIENGELSSALPPTLDRIRLWRRAAVTIKGRPDWVFVKLHCHGMDPRDTPTLAGPSLQRFLHDLLAEARTRRDTVHFVTAREMVNILLAGCDGRAGNPGHFRDYRLHRLARRPEPLGAAHHG